MVGVACAGLCQGGPGSGPHPPLPPSQAMTWAFQHPSPSLSLPPCQMQELFFQGCQGHRRSHLLMTACPELPCPSTCISHSLFLQKRVSSEKVGDFPKATWQMTTSSGPPLPSSCLFAQAEAAPLLVAFSAGNLNCTEYEYVVDTEAHCENPSLRIYRAYVYPLWKIQIENGSLVQWLK